MVCRSEWQKDKRKSRELGKACSSRNNVGCERKEWGVENLAVDVDRVSTSCFRPWDCEVWIRCRKDDTCKDLSDHDIQGKSVPFSAALKKTLLTKSLENEILNCRALLGPGHNDLKPIQRVIKGFVYNWWKPTVCAFCFLFMYNMCLEEHCSQRKNQLVLEFCSDEWFVWSLLRSRLSHNTSVLSDTAF